LGLFLILFFRAGPDSAKSSFHRETLRTAAPPSSMMLAAGAAVLVLLLSLLLASGQTPPTVGR